MPLPFLIYRYGPAIRKQCKYAALAEKHLQTVRSVAAVPDHPNQLAELRFSPMVFNRVTRKLSRE
jgi:hypothetical protein